MNDDQGRAPMHFTKLKHLKVKETFVICGVKVSEGKFGERLMVFLKASNITPITTSVKVDGGYEETNISVPVGEVICVDANTAMKKDLLGVGRIHETNGYTLTVVDKYIHKESGDTNCKTKIVCPPPEF